MARPENRERHMCVYCCKSRLYGPLRHTAPNEYGESRVTTCLPCKKLRDKKRYNHEEMLRYSVERAEKQVKLLRHHMMELAARRNDYSPEFRMEFGGLATKAEVRTYAPEVAEEKENPTLKRLLAEWGDEDDEDDET